eukprot:747186-Hanusia_phi.AAC.1
MGIPGQLPGLCMKQERCEDRRLLHETPVSCIILAPPIALASARANATATMAAGPFDPTPSP